MELQNIFKQNCFKHSGWEDPDSYYGGEGAPPAHDEERSVGGGGGEGCHLQRVPLQRLQPGNNFCKTAKRH